jgi:hypothetical protein
MSSLRRKETPINTTTTIVVKKKYENFGTRKVNIGKMNIIPMIDEDKEIENYTLTKRYHTRGNSRKDSMTVDPQDDQKIGDQEYVLNLKKYLKEAITENEKVNFSDIKSREKI